MPFEAPKFIKDAGARERYDRWVKNKAAAHRRRDRRRYKEVTSLGTYARAIHDAVVRSGGRDVYTRDILRWDQIRTYDDAQARRGGFGYHRSYADLPTLDHKYPGSHSMDFEVIAWRTNSAKGGLSPSEFRVLCKKVAKHSSRQ